MPLIDFFLSTSCTFKRFTNFQATMLPYKAFCLTPSLTLRVEQTLGTETVH